MTSPSDASLLYDAAAEGRLAELERLIATGVDLNASTGDDHDQGTALYAASSQGHIEVVKLLLSSGADPNARGGRLTNALQAASINNSPTHTEIAKILIAHKVQTSMRKAVDLETRFKQLLPLQPTRNLFGYCSSKAWNSTPPAACLDMHCRLPLMEKETTM
jgi:ankyrin repeat protein